MNQKQAKEEYEILKKIDQKSAEEFRKEYWKQRRQTEKAMQEAIKW